MRESQLAETGASRRPISPNQLRNSVAGIVVVHDEWGLTEFIRDVCDRLARAGFVALAPDLFHGRIADDQVAAEQLSKELEPDCADADLESAVAELFNQHATVGAKVGVLGLGLGGSLALLLSSRHRRIGAVVDLYGAQPELLPELERVAAPVLAIFAGEDESVSESTVRRVRIGPPARGRARQRRGKGGGAKWLHERRPPRCPRRNRRRRYLGRAARFLPVGARLNSFLPKLT